MSKAENRRAANGQGSVRKRTKTAANGQEYTFWEGAVTVTLPDGRTTRRAITGKTQREVLEKMQKARVESQEGTYIEPSKLTVEQWLDTWYGTFLNEVKPRTKESYELIIRCHLKPALGKVKLQALNTPMIQAFYNSLSKDRDQKKALSAKTIHGVHGVLHGALKKAVEIGYIHMNPTEACTLPRKERREIEPLDADSIAHFLEIIEADDYRDAMTVTLFTGMRRGEVAGLTWDAVDFDAGMIRINKQLQKVVGHPGEYQLVSTKNGKGRTITPAPSVMNILRRIKVKQAEDRLLAGGAYENGNYVFCNAIGQHISPHTLYHHFKSAAEKIGLPEARFHDLRHSYAVAALEIGDDIKTVQENLGHHTASFTLDVYGHVTDQMRQASANRMEDYINKVKAAK